MKSKIPKTSGYSTGRGTRVKHSSGMDWDEWAKKRRKYPVKYSTGEDGQITHSTGVEFDKKVKYRRKEYENNKPGGAKHPGFTYKHYKKADKSQSENARKVSPKPLKKVIIDY
ncbi:hypothetical protein KAW55_07555 [bacterium]|nr:hypothetical protein [bacterium]